jgi:hypothetical protein
MSSNGITIPECSETSTVTCSQTTQLQSVNTPKKKSISSSVPKLKNKFKTISEGKHTNKTLISEMLKSVDHFNEVKDLHLSTNLIMLMKNYVKLVNRKLLYS